MPAPEPIVGLDETLAGAAPAAVEVDDRPLLVCVCGEPAGTLFPTPRCCGNPDNLQEW